ncbi:MAG: DUF4367 domain-containing protein [Clostridia bacterium]|nr:DUF4367 domain-containing protein [Clostridia bacterium]
MNKSELADAIGDISSEALLDIRDSAAESSPFEKTKAGSPMPAFKRLASVAAAVVLALFISTATAEAAGVRVVRPFISKDGNYTSYEYSSGKDVYGDLPEITADPSQNTISDNQENELVLIDSLDKLKSFAKNKVCLPGDDLGLEFELARVSFTDGVARAYIHYLYNGKKVRIIAHHNNCSYDSEYVYSMTTIKNVESEYTKDICGIESTFIHAASKNYIVIVYENESYSISGNIDMSVLEKIAESMLASK